MKELDKHLMSSKESKIIAEAYETSNYAEINRNREPGKPDSRMYSVELSVLQDYLKMIEEEMESRGIQNKGVRVTMGKYPENSTDPKVDMKYLGYQTIFFSALDLDVNNSERNQNKSSKSAVGSTEDIPDMNYMHLTPPW